VVVTLNGLGKDYWCTPKLLDGLNFESKVEDSGRRRS
jgi:hypothetical protein